MKHLILPAKLESIPKVTAWIDEVLDALDCPMKIRVQIDVAIDEIFSNIAYYAYPEKNGTAEVQIDFDAQERMFSMTFIDSGTPFNPLKRADPNTALGPRERAIGGLGIFLVKKTMHDVIYGHENGHNVLTLKKRI